MAKKEIQPGQGPFGSKMVDPVLDPIEADTQLTLAQDVKILSAASWHWRIRVEMNAVARKPAAS